MDQFAFINYGKGLITPLLNSCATYVAKYPLALTFINKINIPSTKHIHKN
jgi:hypothetical protein